MTRFGRLLLDALKSPSAFERRPWRYLANQSGHMVAVGALGGLLLPWWLVIAAYVAWEAVQVIRFNAEVWDGMEDLGFVTCGLLIAVGVVPVAGPAAIFLASGVMRRM